MIPHDRFEACSVRLGEEARLKALTACQVLDTPPEEQFDRVVRLAAMLARAPIALVSFVDRDRQWFKAKIGLTASSTPRDIAFCSRAIQSSDVLWVEDAASDERFSTNPLVLGPPFVRFYAGAPILSGDGHRLGTVCVIDPVPHPYDAAVAAQLQSLAAIVADELTLRRLLHEASQARSVAAALAASKQKLVQLLARDLVRPFEQGAEALSNLELAGLTRSQITGLAPLRQCGATVSGLISDLVEAAGCGAAGERHESVRPIDLGETVSEILTAEQSGDGASAGRIALHRGDGGLIVAADPLRLRVALTRLLRAAEAADPRTIDARCDWLPPACARVSLTLSPRKGQGARTLAAQLEGAVADAVLLVAPWGGTARVNRQGAGQVRLELEIHAPALLNLPGHSEAGPAPVGALRALIGVTAANERRVLGNILSGLGVDVNCAGDPAQAAEAVGAGGFDLVVLDGDGTDVARMLHGIRRAGGGAPILALGLGACDRAAGFDRMLERPLRFDQLVDTVFAAAEARDQVAASQAAGARA